MCRRSLETNYTDFVCKTLQLIQDFVNIIILCRIKNNLSNSYWRRITGTQISDCGMQRGERFGHEVRARGWINRCGSSWGGDCWGLKTVHVFPLVGLLQSSKLNSSPESGDFFRKNIVSLWRKKKVTRRFFLWTLPILHAFYYKNFLHANYISHYFFWYCFSVELHALTVSTFDEG